MISVDGLTMSGQTIEVAALNHQLESHYDVVECGAGSSGLVTARRLADPDIKVLLLEAGGLRSPTGRQPGKLAAVQSRQRRRLELLIRTQSELERPIDRILDGQGTGEARAST